MDVPLPQADTKATAKILAPSAASLLVTVAACSMRDAKGHKPTKATQSHFIRQCSWFCQH